MSNLCAKMVKKLSLRGRRDEANADKWRNWSDLPDIIVATIGEALLSDDDVLCYYAFRGVCTSWREATEQPVIKERRFWPRKWLLMWGSDEYDPQRFVAKMEFSRKPERIFLNPSTGKYIRAHIPGIHGTIVNACLEGLLLVTGWGSGKGRVTSRLLNPFTGSTIDYPDIRRVLNSVALNESHMPSICFASSTSLTILVIGSRFVAYADPCFLDWKFISRGRLHLNSHMLSQGHIFGFSTFGDLLKIDMEEKQQGWIESRIQTLMSGPPDGIAVRSNERYYLIECNGETLAVLFSPGIRKRQFFRIFKLVNLENSESCGGCDQISLVPVNNIGKHALFVHSWHPGISISTENFPGLYPNSIYFYEKGLLAPKIYRLSETLPNLSHHYCPVKEIILIRRPFLLFPVPYSRHRGRRTCTATGKKNAVDCWSQLLPGTATQLFICAASSVNALPLLAFF